MAKICIELGDVISITGERARQLIGIVTYFDHSGTQTLRPASSAYVTFFSDLREAISASGGEVMHTSVGMQEPGEYVIGGDLDMIRLHLQGAAAQSAGASYHRVSLLENSDVESNQYLLRVVFDLLDGRTVSQQPLSPESSAD